MTERKDILCRLSCGPIYDINESQGEETSANYMAVRLLKAAGLPLTDFQSYLSDLQQNVPFISAHALKEIQEQTVVKKKRKHC